MENRKLLRFSLLAVFWVIFMPKGVVLAYSPETHALFSDKATELYNAHVPGNKIDDGLKNYLIDGSRREDDPPRWLNHFYDPVYNRGLESIYGNGYKSKDWAVDSKKQNDFTYKATTFLASVLSAAEAQKIELVTTETDFTWGRAIRFYINGEKEKAMFTLGHVLHLIQDSAVPDHSRNDAHPFGSPYEAYAKKFTLATGDNNLMSRLSGKSPVLFDNLDAYFIGITKYSNNNFYSQHTLGSESGYSAPAPDYDERLGDYLYAMKKDSANGDYKLFIRKTPAPWNYLISSYNTTLSLDKEGGDLVLRDYWARLSPGAVEYGAGMISLFFKEVEKAKKDPSFLPPVQKSFLGQAIGSTNSLFASVSGALNGFASDIYGLLSGTGSYTSETINLAANDNTDTENNSSEISDVSPTIAKAISLSGSGKTSSTITKPKPTATSVPKTSAKTSALPTPKTSTASLTPKPVATVAAASPTIAVKFCSFATSKSPNHGGVIFNEVAWMGGQNTGDEWIELKNISSEPLDISGWQVIDQDEQIKIILKNGTELAAGLFYLLERGEAATPIKADVLYSGNLKNDSEGLRLFDSNCNLVDEVLAKPNWPAGNNTTKATMERNVGNFNWYTSGLAFGTPRAENSLPQASQSSSSSASSGSSSGGNSGQSSGSSGGTSNTNSPTPTTAPTIVATSTLTPVPTPTPGPTQSPKEEPEIGVSSNVSHVVISEIMVGTLASSSQEFIELYNPMLEKIDLSGFSLKRKATADGPESNLISKISGAFDGKSIPARGYFLLASNQYAGSKNHDARYSQNSTFLADNGDVVILRNANGEVVDKVEYPEIERDKSWERKAWRNDICVSAQGNGEFWGNGCDTDSVSDFELRDNSNPQNTDNFLEPRSAPLAVQNFKISYDSSAMNLVFNWDASEDSSGNSHSLTYQIKDEDSSLITAIYLGAETSFVQTITQIKRLYSFLITVIDREGLKSKTTTAQIVPNFLKENIAMSHSKAKSDLAIDWSENINFDNSRILARYEVNFSETSEYAEDSWLDVGWLNRSYIKHISQGTSWHIGLRAKDPSGTYSKVISQIWDYPPVEVSLSQTENGLLGPIWGMNGTSEGSYQSIAPGQDLKFNRAIIKVVGTGAGDGATLRLSVMEAGVEGSVESPREIVQKVAEADDASGTFWFDEPVALLAGHKYWLKVEIKTWNDSRGPTRSGYQLVLSNDDAYAGGETLDDSNVDWWMKLTYE